jgi:hypothetical protein
MDSEFAVQLSMSVAGRPAFNFRSAPKERTWHRFLGLFGALSMEAHATSETAPCGRSAGS